MTDDKPKSKLERLKLRLRENREKRDIDIAPVLSSMLSGLFGATIYNQIVTRSKEESEKIKQKTPETSYIPSDPPWTRRCLEIHPDHKTLQCGLPRGHLLEHGDWRPGGFDYD